MGTPAFDPRARPGPPTRPVSLPYAELEQELSPARDAQLPAPLPEPPEMLYSSGFSRDDLYDLRHAVAAHATAGGLPGERADDLALAANELACNSVLHGGGTGTLRLWRDEHRIVCEVRDRGLIDEDARVGRRPVPGAIGGAGLWLVNQLTDLVEVRSSPESGTVVRVHMVLPRT
jgi:anti-sigma regulatory factor (Ser/Thr protein kinase)